MTQVMPHALTAGGFHEDPNIARAFLETYMRAFRELQGGIMAAMQQALTAPPAPAPAETPAAPAPAETPATAPTLPAPASMPPHGLHPLGAINTLTPNDASKVSFKFADTPEPAKPVPVHSGEDPRILAGIALPLVDLSSPENHAAVLEHGRQPSLSKEETPKETETATELPSDEPETAPAVDIPPPVVEGLTESEEGTEPETTAPAPNSDTVLAARKQRRKVRGLPRSLRRRTGNE